MTVPNDDLIVAYVYGELRGEEMKAFEARLEADAELRAEVEGLMATRELLDVDRDNAQKFGFDEPPAHLFDAIMNAEPLVRPREMTAAAAAIDKPQLGAEPTWFHRLRMWVVGGGIVATAAAALLLMVDFSEDEMAPTASVPLAAEEAAAPNVNAPGDVAKSERNQQKEAPAPEPMEPMKQEPRADPAPDRAVADGPAELKPGNEGGLAGPAKKARTRRRAVGKNKADFDDDLRSELAKKRDAKLDAKLSFDQGRDEVGGEGVRDFRQRRELELEEKAGAKDAVTTLDRAAPNDPAPAPPPPPAAKPTPTPTVDLGDDDVALIERDVATGAASAGRASRGGSYSPSAKQPAKPKPVVKVQEQYARKSKDKSKPQSKAKPRKASKKKGAKRSPAQTRSSAETLKAEARKDKEFQAAQMAFSSAELALRQGRPAEALTLFQRARARDPRGKVLGYGPRVGQMKSYKLLGRCVETMRIAGAVEKAPMNKPYVIEGLFVAGECAEQLGDDARAERIYQRLYGFPAAQKAARPGLRRVRKRMQSFDAPAAAESAEAADER